MIKREEVFKIGLINKPHGVKGEVSFTFTDDVFDRTDCDYLVLLINGILVPFFLEEYRFRSDDAALVKFEGVDTAEEARRLTNTEVYFPVKYADKTDELPSWNFFVGFEVKDLHHGDLGKITQVDDSTQNILFCIDHAGGELLLPAQEEFIRSIDHEHRIMEVDLPEGLLDM